MATPAPEDSSLHGIQEVAEELGITPRTLRFYEDKGLINPQRMGTMRVYTRREIGRMQLILRGKRLGFSIREIKEFLDLYDVDPEHREQSRRLLVRVQARLADLYKHRHAIDETIAELEQISREAEQRIAAR